MIPPQQARLGRPTKQCPIDLYIGVAELIAPRAHDIPNPDRRRINTNINQILKGRVVRRRVVENRVGASDGVLTGLQVLVLPDPPGAVDLRVVEEEVGVAGRGEEVAACGWVG